MQTAFRYATLAEIKNQLDPSVLTANGGNITDADILSQIESVSALINEWTRQHFQPVPEVVRVGGKGDRLLIHPKQLPFLKLRQVAIIENRTTGQFKGMNRIIPGMEHTPELDYGGRSAINVSCSNYLYTYRLDSGEVAWEPKKRTIELITLIGGFRKGYHNIELSGWWGWIDGYKDFSTTLLTAIPLSTAATTLHVAEVVDPTTGDYINIGDTIILDVKSDAGALVPGSSVAVIVQAIAANGAGGFDITIDPLPTFPFEIPIGAAVYGFGKIPQGIGEVTQFMAVQGTLSLSGARKGDPSCELLLTEKTDNYSYSLGKPWASGTGNGLGKYTGSPRMDLVLRQYAQPAVSIKLI